MNFYGRQVPESFLHSDNIQKQLARPLSLTIDPFTAIGLL